MHFQRLDISDKASVEEFGKWAESELKTVKVLVNSAGQAPVSLQMLTVLLREMHLNEPGFAMNPVHLGQHCKKFKTSDKHMMWCFISRSSLPIQPD